MACDRRGRDIVRAGPLRASRAPPRAPQPGAAPRPASLAAQPLPTGCVPSGFLQKSCQGDGLTYLLTELYTFFVYYGKPIHGSVLAWAQVPWSPCPHAEAENGRDRTLWRKTGRAA